MIANSSEINGRDFYEKQLNLKVRWEQIKKQLSNIKMRLVLHQHKLLIFNEKVKCFIKDYEIMIKRL